jgi:hypothetical protein
MCPTRSTSELFNDDDVVLVSQSAIEKETFRNWLCPEPIICRVILGYSKNTGSIQSCCQQSCDR